MKPAYLRISLLAVLGIFILGTCYYLRPRTITQYGIEANITESELRNQSDIIVRGTFLNAKPRLLSFNDDTSLMTQWKLKVAEVYKGHAEGVITVATPGGDLGGLHVQNLDAVKIQEQDESILYLRWLPEYSTYVIMSQNIGIRKVDNGFVRSKTGKAESIDVFQKSFHIE